MRVEYTLDAFSITVLVVLFILLVVLVIIGVYLHNLMNLIIPAMSTSTILFWTVIVMSALVTFLIIWAIIRLFTHKEVVADSTVVVPGSKISSPTAPTASTSLTIAGTGGTTVTNNPTAVGVTNNIPASAPVGERATRSVRPTGGSAMVSSISNPNYGTTIGPSPTGSVTVVAAPSNGASGSVYSTSSQALSRPFPVPQQSGYSNNNGTTVSANTIQSGLRALEGGSGASGVALSSFGSPYQ